MVIISSRNDIYVFSGNDLLGGKNDKKREEELRKYGISNIECRGYTMLKKEEQYICIKTRINTGFMRVPLAETEGFEPSSLKGHHDFESCPL